MEKDKLPGLPPTAGRVSGLSSAVNATNTSNAKPEPANSGQTSDSNRFSHDISKMPDNPPKNLGHRRAHSEIITLPDDLNFDSDLGVFSGPTATDGHSSDETEEEILSTYLDINKFNSSSVILSSQVGMFSATAAPSAAAGTGGGTWTSGEENASNGVGSSRKPRSRHQHSLSMDGSTSIKPEMLVSGLAEASPAESKKAMSAAKLAELALVDPKRAKRIWANRQSAARSKERKIRYIAELERKIQTLETEATTLSAQLTLLQRDSTGLTAENSELKLRLQTMEQQVYLQDSLNGALKEEIQRLKVLTSQSMSNGGPRMNYASLGGSQQHYPNNHAMQSLLTAQQLQQLQIQSQKHQQHQIPPHLLHQLQQLQLQQQHHQEQQQQTREMRVRASMLSPNRKDGPSSDVSSTASND
ncbi:putative transcription factor PosF21 [Hibiscus syriacus]|uniref:Transcription factor PosF21 n=1 Tax=Hibiscus syriacus TaxID=106335 RepID=A0A6A3A185_HIBSY|nr:probable transcription factor PosF21 [Hibiscus syriacus]KAE8698044.1 putative transcription factor PosF21 [Hibiscus syriacus]